MLGDFSSWFSNIFPDQSVALTCLVMALVAASGLALGSLNLKGLSLGIPGVMFTGLLVAPLLGTSRLNAQVLMFMRDFGLILFVYAVGVQMGPGFLGSLRKRGLAWNALATAVVLLGAALALGCALWLHTDIKAAVGLFAGGTTNAPALGSAGEALRSLYPATLPSGAVQGVELAAQKTAPAFAIAYPFGLLGMILAMVILRWLFHANPHADAAALEAADRAQRPQLITRNIEVANPNLDGLAIKQLPALEKTDVVLSRIFQARAGAAGAIRIPTPEIVVHLGDVLLAVGTEEEIRDFQMIVGKPSAMDLKTVQSDITSRQVVVTKRQALAGTVDDLDLTRKYGVVVTRVSRAGLEFTAVGNLRLQFGDRVRIVGEAADLDTAAAVLGNSARELNYPRLLPIFIGILLGVVLGSLPIALPGLPAPVRLGLASGPMIVAIILSQLGRVGSLIWYMPQSASWMLRELGIVLFLVAVGINGGDGFFSAIRTPVGLQWLAMGALITLVPLLAVGLFARLVLKMNFLHVCGLLCGAMTSPSLPFTQTMTPSEAPAVAFATVYPLTMILRVLVAQLLILVFA